MEYKDLPQRWKTNIVRHLDLNGKNRARLNAGDFPINPVIIDFEDGSCIRFEYAFCIQDDKLNEIAVFTEHCGYHIFNTVGIIDLNTEVLRMFT